MVEALNKSSISKFILQEINLQYKNIYQKTNVRKVIIMEPGKQLQNQFEYLYDPPFNKIIVDFLLDYCNRQVELSSFHKLSLINFPQLSLSTYFGKQSFSVLHTHAFFVFSEGNHLTSM